MRIKELSQATGVDVETIRFYEKERLLPAPARSDNGYRDYAGPHLERLCCECDGVVKKETDRLQQLASGRRV